MDGTLAALVLGASLVDMGLSHCPTGCLAASGTPLRWSVATGTAFFQDDARGAELSIRRDAAVRFDPFQPAVGASLTTEGAAWVGAGALYTVEGAGALYLQGHIMPGLYRAGGGGPDLGGTLQFRSGLEIGIKMAAGIRVGLALDHRSNAGIYDDNPGLETLQIRVSLPAF